MEANKARLSLPSDLEILLVRDFDAPKDLVFETWTRPEYVKLWYGCSLQTIETCEIDLRVGGKWRWVLRDKEGGREHAFSGQYQEIARPDRLVFTQRYEPVPNSDHTVTITLDERAEVTTLSMQFLHASRQNRDGHLAASMETGMQEMMRRIGDLVASLRPRPEARPTEQRLGA